MCVCVVLWAKLPELNILNDDYHKQGGNCLLARQRKYGPTAYNNMIIELAFCWKFMMQLFVGKLRLQKIVKNWWLLFYYNSCAQFLCNFMDAVAIKFATANTALSFYTFSAAARFSIWAQVQHVKLLWRTSTLQQMDFKNSSCLTWTSYNFKMDSHVQYILSQCSQRLYLLKMLKHQGMPKRQLAVSSSSSFIA